MVEISMSGSGEGPGRDTGRGYSTASLRALRFVARIALRCAHWKRPGYAGPEGGSHVVTSEIRSVVQRVQVPPG